MGFASYKSGSRMVKPIRSALLGRQLLSFHVGLAFEFTRWIIRVVG
jgi:hypothetical protein